MIFCPIYTHTRNDIFVEQTIDIASSISSLFRPATRPLRDSSTSRSFLRRTCLSSEAAFLNFAWKLSPSQRHHKLLAKDEGKLKKKSVRILARKDLLRQFSSSCQAVLKLASKITN